MCPTLNDIVAGNDFVAERRTNIGVTSSRYGRTEREEIEK